MEPVPTPPVLARWDLPGDAAVADHMAKVALRRQRAAAFGSTRPFALFAAFVLVLGVLAVQVRSPAMLIGCIVFAVVFTWVIVRAPHRLAEAVRRLPTAHEPYTVTLDADGVHMVGPSFADHLRWRVFQDAAVDEGFLVMGRRGSKVLQLLPLETLDPRIDRDWLGQQVAQLIAADAAQADVYSPR